MWYGLKIGLTLDETLDLPVGVLYDLIACEQVKHEGCTLQEAEDDEDAFWRLLERK